MAQLKLLQDCNHEITERNQSISTITMRRCYRIGDIYNGGDIDPIEHHLSGGTDIEDKEVINAVSTIDKIEQNIGGKLITLSPEIYNLYDNRIVWTRKYKTGVTGKYRVPNTGESYNVTLKHTKIKFAHYSPDNCVRCNGTGWYVAPLTLERGIEIVRGPVLVAQEFLKCLLTTSGSDYLDGSYGASLLGNNGTVNYMDRNLSNNIRDAIRNAEVQCIQNADFGVRTAGEILDRAVINTIEPNYDNSGVCISITLYTLEGSRISFNVGT